MGAIIYPRFGRGDVRTILQTVPVSFAQLELGRKKFVLDITRTYVRVWLVYKYGVA